MINKGCEEVVRIGFLGKGAVMTAYSQPDFTNY